ncbi:MAG: hypothetical protein AB7U30_10140 [Sulfuricellaceae bacterium]|jgi:hypothetical protein
MNTSSFLSRFDAGAISSERELAEGFQRLLNNGQIWSLQERYVNAALGLIDVGLCYAPGQMFEN